MSKEFLSELVHYRTYANFLPEEGRRETIAETINRNCAMHTKKYPGLKNEIEEAYKEVHALRAVPSMRSMQFGGAAIERRNNRMFNCSFINITSVEDIADLFYMSMSGCGVGYSIKQRHVSQLPTIPTGHNTKRYIIPDSAEGWADTVIALFENPKKEFDYKRIRPAGTKLSSGGTASGPAALMLMHAKVREILQVACGRQLTSFEAHRICCLIADCVVVGGVRRAALITLFDYEDKETMYCKAGNWWEKYPELARANNSCHINRNDADVDVMIRDVVQACFDGGQAEPGLMLTNDMDFGTNPCAEIALRSNGVCNLTEVNAGGCKTKEEFFQAVTTATIIGTLQASYTNFEYVSPKWKKVAEEEALLGVSITGQAEAAHLLTPENLQAAAALAVSVNRAWAEKLGIKPALRITTTKPSGSASSWLGTTAGVHAAHAERFIRRVRMQKESALGLRLAKFFPNFVAVDPFNQNDIVMQIPIEFKGGVILRDKESAIECLERVRVLYHNWIVPGHIEGNNTHNVSLTINYHEEEKEDIIDWMVQNKTSYYGISLIPFNGADYQYAPYICVHKEIFTILQKSFKEISQHFKFTDIKELQDNTDKKAEAACSGGACAIGD